jgi:glucokinase
MAYIGVDLGGTKISVSKIIGNSCENATRSLIPNEGSENEILDFIKNAISKSIDEDVVAIGIGVPSLVDQRLGIVYDVQNIPSWKKVYLKDFLENHFNIPVFVNNDANCFSLGELYFGDRKNLDSFVGLTIGTGIAGGIIINKKLYNGSNSGAGEFGMLPYLDGNFEDYCSGQFFQKIHGIAGEKVFSNAKAGDAEALSLYSTFGKHLGNLIIQVLYTFDPETIILGGSVSKAYTHFRSGIQLSLNQFAYQNSISNLKIILSSDPDISVKGAAALCY